MTALIMGLSLTLIGLDDGPEGPSNATPAPASAPGNAAKSSGDAAMNVVTALETVMADAIARAEPSVVAIHRQKGEKPGETLAVRGRKPPTAPGWPEEPGARADGHAPIPEDFISFDYGSGAVIDAQGRILTAYHVVQGARSLIVEAADHQWFYAEILAADPRSDLAVIAPRPAPGAAPPKLVPIAIGNADKLRKGSFLIALGNPFNAARRDGSPSASWGILSNRARRLEFDRLGLQDHNGPRLHNYPTLLQLDAKLNLGMSGGAVINLKGELVAITTTAASPTGFDDQAGYAIPMGRIERRAVEALRAGREVEYGLLGIRVDPRQTNRVGEVQPNSPAARGHLQFNDEILAVNNAPVRDFDSLILAINEHPPGAPVRLKVKRAGKVTEEIVVLAKFPVDGEIIATNRPRPWRGLRVDYTTPLNYHGFALELDEATAGVVITEVQEGSPAAAAGLKPGQLVRKVGTAAVSSPRDFARAVEGADGAVPLETDLGTVTVGK